MADKPTPTLYLLEHHSNSRFLVDSGAEVSLLPPTPADRAGQRQGPPLTAANGSTIRSFGTRTEQLQFQGQTFSWTFVVADVPCAILGADFLRDHALLVDVKSRCLINSADYSIISGFVASPSRQRVFRVTAPPDRFRQLLLDRPALTTPAFDREMPAHGVELCIETSGPPVFARSRRLSPEKLAAAKEEFAKMERLGIIRRSKSNWSSPLHLVPKADGSFRPCGDFRRLNNVTKPDKYPIPYLSDSTHFLQGKTIFSKVDLIRGYHQIPVAEADIPKTAVCTPFGLFEWVKCPFGLRNAAQAFQRIMDQVGGDLDFIFIYLDDILIASSSEEEHYRHLETLFDRLESYGLVVNPAKCLFAVKELEFLGHTISAAGSSPLPSKVEAVTKFPSPTTVKGMMEFCGMVNFYNRYIPRINIIMSPLFAAMAGRKKQEQIQWSPELESAFNAAKSALSSAALLSHPSLDAPTALTTDASDLGMGAVLEQFVNRRWRPLAFFSKKFNNAQKQYSAFDRELMAIHMAIRNFRFFLEGRQFVVYTDHKPLTAALSKISDPWSARQARHLSAVAEYTSDIRHVEGKLNPVADALSRHVPAPTELQEEDDELPTLPPTISTITSSATDLNNLSIAQQADTDLLQFVNNYSGQKHVFGQVKLPDSDRHVICELSRPAPRPLVPDVLRRPITLQLHSLVHPGRKASVRLVSDRFFWPDMAKTIRGWVASCIPCQKSKVHRHIRTPTEFIPVPDGRFQHINIDIVGPLPPSRGFTHLLTIVDRFSRWPEAVPLTDTSTPTLCAALMYNWVSRFGVPLLMTSDRGSQFTSSLWSQMSTLLGVQLNRTTAYHPEANGMVERMHRRLKEALKTRLTGPDWYDQLPWVLLGLRTTVKDDLRCSSAEFVFGAPISLPGDCLPSQQPRSAADSLHDLRETVGRFRPIQTAHHTAPRPAGPQLPPDTAFVFVRRDGHKPPLVPAYDGPFRVLQQDDKTVRIEKGLSSDVVSVDRCKAASVDADVTVQVPARRGRPPLTQPPVVPRPRLPSDPQPQLPPAPDPQLSQPARLRDVPQRGAGRPARFKDFVSP